MKRPWRVVWIALIMTPLLVGLYGVGPAADSRTAPEPAAGDSPDRSWTLIPLAGDRGIAHGDTSVSDQELIKQYGKKMPDQVMMDEFAKKVGGTPFPHQKHVENKVARCGACHHENPRDIKPCWECHGDEPKEPKAPKYLKAHHDLCINCHKSIKAEKGLGSKDKPPDKMCYDCHLKKDKDASCPDETKPPPPEP